MAEDRFEKVIRKRFREANASGIHPPVIAVLKPESGQAQAVYAERHGRPLASAGSDYRTEYGLMEMWSVADAVRLLRRHGHIGGAAVANLLVDPSRPADWYIVTLLERHLMIGGFSAAGDALFDSGAFYDRLPYRLCRRCTRKYRGKGLMRVDLEDHATAVVCGHTTGETAAAARLVKIASSGQLPGLFGGGMEPVTLPLGDEELALILRDIYGRRPRVIAEAIQGLRKLPGCRDAWLTRVLNGTPSLSELAGAVRREVGVEQPEAQ